MTPPRERRRSSPGAALLEVTRRERRSATRSAETVEGEDVLTLLFAATWPATPAGTGRVTSPSVDDGEPTVLETELMPGDGALLAPDWVPWSERLADYRAAQARGRGRRGRRRRRSTTTTTRIDDDSTTSSTTTTTTSRRRRRLDDDDLDDDERRLRRRRRLDDESDDDARRRRVDDDEGDDDESRTS